MRGNDIGVWAHMRGLERIKGGMANKKSERGKKSKPGKATRKQSSRMNSGKSKPGGSSGKIHGAAKRVTGKAGSRRKPPTKDPEGGLTAEGRKMFARKEGSHLRPGVTGAADTPEKMRRKGSFLRRHFANPRGPMERDGEPTRLALSAHAWGERVPKTMADARKLAAKGEKLLTRYKKTRERARKS